MAGFDVILVGGGLANGLVAMRLAALRPELKVLVVEAGDRIGGNHTWSFHETDVTSGCDRWLKPIVSHSWSGQEVRFPTFARRLAAGYRSVASEDLARHVSALGSVTVALRSRVEALSAGGVMLAGGERVDAPCVVDGRGLRWLPGVAFGYQKFVGLEVETRKPHGLVAPLIMDATVAQIDGYRFVYCLPYSETRVLIEDTYYADSPHLDADAVVRRARAYADAAGWGVASVVRDEAGVLPITLEGALADFWPPDAMTVARSGMRAGLFHPTTGYSLPLATEVADALAALRPLASATAARTIRAIGERTWERQAFFRLLNRLLFISARPDERRDVMQRFYCLPEPLIERFYAGYPSAMDKFQILFGRPPIPLLRALQGMSPASARSRRGTLPRAGSA